MKKILELLLKTIVDTLYIGIPILTVVLLLSTTFKTTESRKTTEQKVEGIVTSTNNNICSIMTKDNIDLYVEIGYSAISCTSGDKVIITIEESKEAINGYKITKVIPH